MATQKPTQSTSPLLETMRSSLLPMELRIDLSRVLSVVAASQIALRDIREIRTTHASEALQALSNEIANLRLVLLDADEVLGLYLPNSNEEISQIHVEDLKGAQKALRNLEGLLSNRVMKSMGEGKEHFLGALTRDSGNDGSIQLLTKLRKARQRMQTMLGPLDRRTSAKISEVLTSVEKFEHDSTRLDILLDQDELKEEPEFSSGEHEHGSSQHKLELLSSLRPKSNSLQYTRARTQVVSVSVARIFELPLTHTHYLMQGLGYRCLKQRTSSRLQTLLGNLFISYATTPIGKECELKAEIVLIYEFPLWILHYEILFHTRYRHPKIWTLGLSIRAKLSYDHIVWDMIAYGDIEGMRRLLGSNQVAIESQNDAGMTLLHVRSNSPLMRCY